MGRPIPFHFRLGSGACRLALHTHRGLDTHYVQQTQFGDAIAKSGCRCRRRRSASTGAAGISRSKAILANLLQSNFRLGLKLDFPARYSRGLSPLLVPASTLRVSRDANQRGNRQAHLHAVLIDKLTATRQFSCFASTCPQYWRVTPTEITFLFSPSPCHRRPKLHDRSVLLHRRQSVLPHCFQKIFIAPGRMRDHMVQRLMGLAHVVGTETEPPSVPHSCVRREEASPCNQGLQRDHPIHVPWRHAPGVPNKPRSVFAGRLAQQSWRS